MSISVVIPTLNEARFLPVCLESVKWAQEIIIVDSGSTDTTLEIAKKYTNKIIKHKWEGFAAQKNKGLEVATGDWVLFIDADERVSKGLREELQRLDNQNYNIYQIPRLNYIFGKALYHGGWYPDYQRRLIKRSDAQGWSGTLHENLIAKNEKCATLKHPIAHLTHRGMTWSLNKTIQYTQYEAQLHFQANHPPVKLRHFIAAMARTFWYRGVKEAGWKDGLVGWIEIIYQTFNAFIMYVYLWELQQKPLENQYDEIDRKIKNEL